MAQLVQETWIWLVIAVAVALLVAWWLLSAGRRTRVQRDSPAGEDAPVRRNQALIDAPPVAGAPLAGAATGLAGAADAVAAVVLVAEPPAVEPQVAESLAGDDLTRIKGLGPKLAEQLHTLDVTRFAQIADWDDAEIDRIDAQLGRFQGRIRRDDWPAQARLLAAGDAAAYEARFGRLS